MFVTQSHCNETRNKYSSRHRIEYFYPASKVTGFFTRNNNYKNAIETRYQR